MADNNSDDMNAVRRLQQLFRSGGNIAAAITSGAKEARDWFRAQITQLQSVSGNEFMTKNPERFLKSNKLGPGSIGKMVLYYYDPKTKQQLPYYDRFPCIFMVDLAERGHYGINLHYLSPYQRLKLFNALVPALVAGKNERRRLKISYDVLKGASQLGAFKPCFKRYLSSHVRSRFYIVPPSEWMMVMMLPLARFERGGKGGGTVGGSVSQNRIWRESRARF